MDAHQIDRLVKEQIGDAWDKSNLHGVTLRDSVMPAERITVVDQSVVDGKVVDQLVEGWLVLIEDPVSRSGYRIIAADDGSEFGLAYGLPTDEHLVLCGWYCDFMKTFEAM